MKKTNKILLLLLACLLLLPSCSGENEQSGDIVSGEESQLSADDVSKVVIGHESGELSAELYDFSIKINDAVYKLPAMQSAFQKNGFTVTEKESDTVKAGFVADGIISDGNTAFDVQVVNPTKSPLPFLECAIGRLSYDFKGTAEISIADGFSLNSATKKAILEKFGVPDITETHSDFSEITYGNRKTSGNYASYLFRFDKNGKIIYFSVVKHYMPES